MTLLPPHTPFYISFIYLCSNIYIYIYIYISSGIVPLIQFTIPHIYIYIYIYIYCTFLLFLLLTIKSYTNIRLRNWLRQQSGRQRVDEHSFQGCASTSNRLLDGSCLSLDPSPQGRLGHWSGEATDDTYLTQVYGS